MTRRLTVFAAIVIVVAVGWLVGRSARPTAPEAPSASTPPAPANHLAPPPVAGEPDLVAQDPTVAPSEDINPLAVGPEDQLHPRPADEWQGMLVDMSMRQLCETSAQCGFALACLDDGQCGPCDSDSQCGAGEACVLDHCVPADNVACRGRADCAAEYGEDALCVMNGLTGGEARGNSGMSAYCLAPRGGQEQDDSVVDDRRAARLAAAAEAAPVRPPVSKTDLADRLDVELSE